MAHLAAHHAAHNAGHPGAHRGGHAMVQRVRHAAAFMPAPPPPGTSVPVVTNAASPSHPVAVAASGAPAGPTATITQAPSGAAATAAVRPASPGGSTPVMVGTPLPAAPVPITPAPPGNPTPPGSLTSPGPLPANVGASLQDLYQQYQHFVSSGGSGTFSPTGLSPFLMINGTSVGVSIHDNNAGDFASLVAQLQSDGLQIIASDPTTQTVQGMLPIASLPTVAQLPQAPSVVAMFKPMLA